MTDKAMIDKISKLLKLSNSPNANEAAAALNKAHELMEREGITTAEVSAADEYADASIPARAVCLAWESSLISIIRDSFGVYIVRHTEKELVDEGEGRLKTVRIKKTITWAIYGKPHRVKYAEYALTLALKAVNRARRDKLAATPVAHSKAMKIYRASEVENFCAGYVHAIHLQLKHLYPLAAPEVAAAKDMMLVNRGGQIIGTAKCRRPQYDMRHALNEGVKAGKEFKIFQPVNGSEASAPLAIEQ